MLYGPGTGKEDNRGLSVPVHVDAAAQAAVLAIEHGSSGIYNVAADNPHVDSSKARRELHWDPAFRVRCE
jgi:hypothetical protein